MKPVLLRRPVAPAQEEGDRPVFQRAPGPAERSSGRRNTSATAFNFGSLNKLFTTITIRQ